MGVGEACGQGDDECCVSLGESPSRTKQLLILPCDILVPAALERQITEANASASRCRILAEAANGSHHIPEADVILAHVRDFVHPCILCNAGGVVVSYFEWVQDLQSLLLGRN
jgi:glutamate dehydrogenase (NAD(P)+)